MSSKRRMDDYRTCLRTGTNRSSSKSDAKVTTPARSSAELLLAFWRILRGHRTTVAWSLALSTLATLLKLVPPALTKFIIDALQGVGANQVATPEQVSWYQDAHLLLYGCAALIVIVSFIAVALQLWSRWCIEKMVHRIQITLRKQVFQQALRLPIHRVHELKSGGLTNILRDDAGSPASLVANLIYDPWRAVIQLFGTLVILVCVDWRLVVGGFLLLPMVYLTHRTWIERIRPLFRDLRKQRQLIDAHATEALGGMRMIRAFSRERLETKRLIQEQTLLVRMQRLVWWRARVIAVTWNALIPLASTALLLYGGHQILAGNMTLGELTMFLIYLAMLLDPLATLSNIATAFQNDLAGLDRTLDLLSEPAEFGRGQRKFFPLPSSIDGEISFHGVGFRYPSCDEFVLRDIDLDVQRNETIALVGRSGAGKTTLCNLIARFYEPTEGLITLDGQDLSRLDVDDYRKLLGIVEQDVFLFDDTVFNNIAYARRDATPEQIEEAARVAHAHEFISELPMGYATAIGERGFRLSAGQKQRIAMARAVLADPRILILDEATSNLDSESEQLIWEAMAKLFKGRTSFVIAHRMSTIVGADRIAVLQDGSLLEIGTHEDLMASSDYYRRIIEIQTSGFAGVVD